MNARLLLELARYPTATIHEAQGRIGALPAAIKPIVQGLKMCAPAYCVRTTPGNNLKLHQALYAAPKGSVLVVATGGSLGHEFGYWGDILTVAAQERGLAGLVIDGGVRDADEIEESGFPVFCRMLAIRGTLKAPEGELGGAVTIGDTRIDTGDIVVGDRDGVVVIAASTIEAAITKSRERTDKENDVIRQLREGRTTLEIFGF